MLRLDGTNMIDIAHDSVYALASSGARSLFAARQSGLYRSNDAGVSWTPLYTSLQLAEPLATTAIITATNAGAEHLFAGVPGGILRSHDGGASWQVTMLPAAPTITALAVSPRYDKDGTLLAATLGDGVVLSVDRGQHWAHWSFGLLDLQVLCLAVSPDFAHDTTVYAGTETGLFRSINGGRSWREVALPCDAPVTSIALSPPTFDSALFVGTDGQGLWRLRTRGATWEACPNVPADDLVVSVQMVQSHIVVATNTTAAISRDGGDTWAFAPKHGHAADITAATFADDYGKPTMMLGYDDGHIAIVRWP